MRYLIIKKTKRGFTMTTKLSNQVSTKQSRIENVLREHGLKCYSVKQLANYAKVSPKTFRTRCSKLKAMGCYYTNSFNKNHSTHAVLAII